MPSNYGISISIICSGSILEEYAWQSLDERTVSCFVPSVSGQNFEILLTNNLNLQDVSVSITVDGNPIGRYYLAPGKKMLPGIYVSETMTKPFLFRNLVFNDEKGIHNPQFFSWENTGSMEFSICRCRQTSIEQFRPQDPTLVSQTTRNGQARAGTPSILTGGEVPIKTIQGVGGVTIDPPDKPYAKILIRYRPIEILSMQGAIPTASSRPSTASSTAVSLPGRKRSIDSTYLLAELSTRPPQRLRETSFADRSPPRLNSSHSTHSRNSSGTWPAPPALNLISSGTSEELVLMKSQLKYTTEQMNNAMQQMRSSMELMCRSMRQMQFLQQRIEAIEARQLPPPPSTTLPPIHSTHQSPPSTASGPPEEQDEPAAQGFTSFAEGTERWAEEQEFLNEGAGELQWPS